MLHGYRCPCNSFHAEEYPDAVLLACAHTLLPMHVQIAEVVNLMDNWGFSYVENLTWVHMAPNNTVVAAPSLYARRSHSASSSSESQVTLQPHTPCQNYSSPDVKADTQPAVDVIPHWH